MSDIPALPLRRSHGEFGSQVNMLTGVHTGIVGILLVSAVPFLSLALLQRFGR